MNYRLKIIEKLGGQCMYHDEETGLSCSMRWDRQPIDNVDMLHVEHVHGGGKKDRMNFATKTNKVNANGRNMNGWGSSTYYQHILENLHTNNYQLLCANHHALKTAMERRARKEAQALAERMETSSEPDTITYEQNNKNSIITESFSPIGYVNYNTTLDRFQGTVYISPSRQLTSPLPNYFTLACDYEK